MSSDREEAAANARAKHLRKHPKQAAPGVVEKVQEVAGKAARELSDDDVLKILAREAKRRREAAAAFQDAGRDEQAAAERAEDAVLADYLPVQLSDAEVAALVTAAIAATGASGLPAMGQVMKAVTPQVAGRAEGSRVAAEVRRQLAG